MKSGGSFVGGSRRVVCWDLILHVRTSALVGCLSATHSPAEDSNIHLRNLSVNVAQKARGGGFTSVSWRIACVVISF